MLRDLSPIKENKPLFGTIDFSIVVFGDEIPLLELLAKSFNLFGEDVGTIHVIINDRNSEKVAKLVRDRCLPAFGRYERHVKLYLPEDFGVFGVSGYQAQQSYKLAVATKVDGEFVVSLDAKNHFLRRFNIEDWLKGDKVRMRKLVIGKAHHNYLKQSMYTFGIDDFDVQEPAVPTVTPYVMRTDVMLRVLSHIEEKYRQNIFDYLSSEYGRLRTEFFLYYGAFYTDPRGGDALAVFDAWRSPTLFGEWPEPNSKEAFARINEAMTGKMFAVHRRRYKTLTNEEIEAISSIWISRGLFDTEKECSQFILEMKSA